MNLTKKLNSLIGGSPSAPFTPALNNIRGVKKPMQEIPKYKPKAIPPSNIIPVKKKMGAYPTKNNKSVSPN